MIFIDENGNRKEITNEEYQLLIDAANAWSKEAHIAEINALHEAEFEKRVLKAGYKQDLKEFERTLADTRSQWHEEAKAINAYWLNGEITINNYAETVTEETAQDPIVFVSSI